MDAATGAARAGDSGHRRPGPPRGERGGGSAAAHRRRHGAAERGLTRTVRQVLNELIRSFTDIAQGAMTATVP
ncbi:hypothetical protein SCOCK_810015 [Actinacidiphila cocklensis]|uniref:Uncharacterized protein n=1 Tax=Actinacidiphila cocklensis TaxID=887465 RepID=A0A9W4GW07_9ACTN|nr:hypothetical protein SCOCK_810015 [Actinacidiphila cocklensis]